MPLTKVQKLVEKEAKTESHADRLAVLKEIKSDIDAMIKATQELAVEDGIAEYKTCERTNVPNLSWWKANKPKSWAKYCTVSTYDRFSWIK
tara:strand:- start:70 stop:342 length:273 start_codon:yes stop_codon:yes gene_type:complete